MLKLNLIREHEEFSNGNDSDVYRQTLSSHEVILGANVKHRILHVAHRYRSLRSIQRKYNERLRWFHVTFRWPGHPRTCANHSVPSSSADKDSQLYTQDSRSNTEAVNEFLEGDAALLLSVTRQGDGDKLCTLHDPAMSAVIHITKQAMYLCVINKRLTPCASRHCSD